MANLIIYAIFTELLNKLKDEVEYHKEERF